MELPLVARKSVSFIPTAEYLRKLARKQCKKDVIANILQGSLGIPKTVAEGTVNSFAQISSDILAEV